MDELKKWLSELFPSPIDTGARMFFVLFLLSSWVTTEHVAFKLPLRVLALAALIVPPLHRDPRLWAAFAVYLAAKTFRFWFSQDNHVFLLTWFAIAMALSLRAPDPERAIRLNARRLIGLSFFFAALWKGPLSGEFLDGSYFSYTFLTDPRFHGVARLFGGVTERELRESYAATVQLASAGTEVVTLAGVSPRLLLAGKLAAWWTFAIESALALTFLARERWTRLHRARHAVLLLFAATTYLAIDIETFGWSLMAIGATQTEPERPGLRALYVATAILVLTYDYVPFLDYAVARLL